jgi:hypothetical protein
MKTLQAFVLLTLCALPICAQTNNTINTPVTIPALKSLRPAQPASAPLLIIKAGTPLEIELAYTVSSGDLTEGDAISFRALHPLKIGDKIAIERGALATARVTKAEGGKSWGRGGKLGWMIQNIIAADGTPVPLRFVTGTEGNGAPGTVVTGIVLTSLIFWPAAPLWGFKHGKPAVIPAGKRFEVFIDRDTEISSVIAPPPTSTPTRAESHYTPASSAPKKPEQPTSKSKKNKEWWEMK